MYEIRHYLTTNQKDVYLDWSLKLRDTIARIAIDRRINRIEQGNFGDHKFCRDGVWEMRTLTALVNIGRIGRGDPTMKSKAHDDAMAELYKNDPVLALQTINSILDDGDQGELLVVLRQMTKAFGGVQSVADKAHLNPTQLYRTLSPDGNPALSSLSAILKAMDLRLTVQSVHPITPHTV